MWKISNMLENLIEKILEIRDNLFKLEQPDWHELGKGGRSMDRKETHSMRKQIRRIRAMYDAGQLNAKTFICFFLGLLEYVYNKGYNKAWEDIKKR